MEAEQSLKDELIKMNRRIKSLERDNEFKRKQISQLIEVCSNLDFRTKEKGGIK